MADGRLRRHLSQDEMNRGIGMLHSGLSQRHVANVLGVSQSVVSRMWNRFITTGNVRHLHAGGRERSTNEVQDRFLVVQARRHRFDNATMLRRDFQNATGVRISTQTNDNARAHRARITDQYLEQATIVRMEWPARSPDLNPIEHAWDMLQTAVSSRPVQPASVQELRQALLEEWDQIPQYKNRTLISSMRRSCQAVIEARRHHTHY